MKNIFGTILHGCEDVSQLVVRSSDEPLTLSEKTLMHTHFLFCKCCKNFSKESASIDKALSAYFNSMQKEPPARLSDERKVEMEEILRG
jgi:hypothetical protein